MVILTEGLEPLKEAQAQLLVRLDSVVVELQTMSEVLHEIRDVLASQSGDADFPFTVAANGQGAS